LWSLSFRPFAVEQLRPQPALTLAPMGQTECSMSACRPCTECDCNRHGEAGSITYTETHTAHAQAPEAAGHPVLLGGSPRKARGLDSDGKFVAIVPSLGGEGAPASWDVPDDAGLQVEKVARMEQMWSRQREEREKKQAEEEKQLRRQQRKLQADSKIRQQHQSALDQIDMMADEELTKLQKKEKQARVRKAAAQQAKEEAAARQASELEAAKVASEAFLKARGFKSILAPRRALCGASAYALHMAVEENKADTVRALLSTGARQDQKDSSNMTAVDIGERCNKNGSHDRVLELLRGE